MRRAADFFSFGYFVAISFPNRIDVWDRLCKYFEPFELMTFGGRGQVCLQILKDDGAQHPTGAHAIGVKHLKVVTRSASRVITRTKSLSRSHICLACKNMA